MHNLLENLFLLKYLPKLTGDPNFALLFLFGMLTSFHCTLMCGGILISQTIKNTNTKNLTNKSGIFNFNAIFYNLGRIISYTIIGGVVGGLGQLISFNGVIKGIVPIIGGIFMIIMAINLLGIFSFLRRLNFTMPSFVAKKIFSENSYSPLIVGLLSGLMPCVPLQMIQLYALSTKSVMNGAIAAFIFSLGTVPLLLLVGTVNTFLSAKFSKIISKISAVVVLVLAVIMIGRGLAITGVDLSRVQIVNNGGTSFATVNGKNQTVVSQLKPDTFLPIVVIKGIPIKWIMHVSKENLNACNKEFDVPRFNIKEKLVVGDNTVQFISNKSGEFTFSCFMGMIKSKIIVVDSIDDLRKLKTIGINN